MILINVRYVALKSADREGCGSPTNQTFIYQVVLSLGGTALGSIPRAHKHAHARGTDVVITDFTPRTPESKLPALHVAGFTEGYKCISADPTISAPGAAERPLPGRSRPACCPHAGCRQRSAPGRPWKAAREVWLFGVEELGTRSPWEPDANARLPSAPRGTASCLHPAPPAPPPALKS